MIGKVVGGVVMLLFGFVAALFVPPVGIAFMLGGVISIIVGLINGTGKLASAAGKGIVKTLTTKKCPSCKSDIDVNATICPMCRSSLSGS